MLKFDIPSQCDLQNNNNFTPVLFSFLNPIACASPLWRMRKARWRMHGVWSAAACHNARKPKKGSLSSSPGLYTRVIQLNVLLSQSEIFIFKQSRSVHLLIRSEFSLCFFSFSLFFKKAMITCECPVWRMGSRNMWVFVQLLLSTMHACKRCHLCLSPCVYTE